MIVGKNKIQDVDFRWRFNQQDSLLAFRTDLILHLFLWDGFRVNDWQIATAQLFAEIRHIRLRIYEVDIDNPPDEYFQFTIIGFPTFVFCINGDEVECMRGSQDLEKLLMFKPDNFWRIPR